MIVSVLLAASSFLGVFGALNQGWREESVRKIADRVAERLLEDKILAEQIAATDAERTERLVR